MAQRPLVSVLLAELVPYERNPRTHPPAQIEAIAESMRRWGWTAPILIDEHRNVIAGHGRIEAAKLAGFDQAPAIVIEGLSPEEKRALVIADNRIGELAGWDETLLRGELEALRLADFPLDLTGFAGADLAGILGGLGDPKPPIPEVASLQERFLAVPFSVLNAREGWWQDRKRAWISIGIRSEIGRGDNLIKRSLHERVAHAHNGQFGRHYAEVRAFIDECRAKGLSDEEILQAAGVPQAGQAIPGGAGVNAVVRQISNGTSVFDPVLCELVYRWFSPKSGIVLDPFAGGSVRGVVAAMLGRHYHGTDLSAEQIAANREQWDAIGYPGRPAPRWETSDARNIAQAFPDLAADLLFSCPPYGDLERYSDDPADLSTMSWEGFLEAYRDIIAASSAMLRNDRFAAFVVGEVRDREGAYRGLVPETIRAFEDAGLRYYNEAILVTAVGTLAIRAAGYFTAARKLGRTHQTVLVFVKGDPKAATEALGELEPGADFAPPEEEEP